MEQIFEQPASAALEHRYDYCAGCGHGITIRLIAEVLDELELRERTIGVLGVGCYSTNPVTFDFDCQLALHGRAPAMATAVKRLLPDRLVFTLQGDGDLAAIGTTEIVHAAMRGDCFTTLLLNNANFGETGGHLAPTTLVGQRTPSSREGRNVAEHGYPTRITEMLALLDGASYVARVAVHKPTNVLRARAAIKKAFQVQLSGQGFSMVEVLTACPSGWRLTPVEAHAWIDEVQTKTYPLGELKKAAQ
ncbi:MAG: thiamine pyrophosphate-dependent enzyme [Alphaproteobacteria bacterium]|nr:thiamine pyrophosphate-dependent enzyme [Alphaproteobacteria bacterium]MDP6516539.1 thiamine pyrophosphate-dependent enzyme [Alphaproteobacteria bacterium]